MRLVQTGITSELCEGMQYEMQAIRRMKCGLQAMKKHAVQGCVLCMDKTLSENVSHDPGWHAVYGAMSGPAVYNTLIRGTDTDESQAVGNRDRVCKYY